MKNGTIVHEEICLFCGKPKKQKWEEYSSYWECDCPDAVKTREIEEQIRKLRNQLPREKYEVREELVLYKI